MVPLAAGLVVLVRFPFSDLSQTKLRPAIVLADAGRGDWILWQRKGRCPARHTAKGTHSNRRRRDATRFARFPQKLTSKPYADSAAVALEDADFDRGSLHVTSYARPGKLFTASGDLVQSVVGVLQPESFRKVIAAVVTLLGGTH